MADAGRTSPDTGGLVISLDFELAWGMKAYGGDWRGLALQAREVVPRLLEMLVSHEAHATWATVGLLMCEDAQDALAQAPEVRPQWRDPRLDSYAGLAEVRGDLQAARGHFAPDLVRAIVSAPGQELATHTFGHYLASESGHTLEAFRADLQAAVRVAERFGPPPRSIVFPRNQVEPRCLPVCVEEGIEVYRGVLPGRLHEPRSLGEGVLSLPRALRIVDVYVPLRPSDCYPLQAPQAGLPLNLPGSRLLRPGPCRLRAMESLKLRRVLGGMRCAARRGHVYHLWWHPHNFVGHTDHKLAVLESVLAELRRLRESHGLRSMSMAEARDTVGVVAP